MLLNRQRALDTMAKFNLDALIATTPENVYYLSDFGPEHSFTFALYGASAAILPRDESIPPTLIVGDQDVPHLIGNPTWMPEVRAIRNWDTYVAADANLTEDEERTRAMWAHLHEKGPQSVNRQELVSSILRELGLAEARLGFDDVRVMLDLRKRGIAPSGGVDAVDVFREIRVVKTPEEVEILRRAAQINQGALLGASQLLIEGMTIREIRNYWRTSMALHGAIGVDFTSGGLDRPWPTYPDGYRLKAGDHLLLDVGGTYKHYWADVGRIGCVGPPSERVLRLQGDVLDVYRTCLPMLRPGAATADIKEAAREAASEELRRGLTPLIHPLGLEVYEVPQPMGEIWREAFTLERAMVISFECCAFAEFPWGTMQMEDTFLITDDEPEPLGILPQTLMGWHV